eukprot:Gb_10668 [translate_table: standard]
MKNCVIPLWFFLLSAVLPLPSHQLNQHEALKSLLKARRSHGLINTAPWLSRSSTLRIPSINYNPVHSHNADLIEALPGQPPNVGFKQYSGYVTVDSSKGRALFYYFTEAANDPATKPLLLWLNGGPGCSSLGYGAMTELGQFRVNSDGKSLSINPYAWNLVANTLFLESPAGVGFSYSNTTTDYKEAGDTNTAEDSYTFLVNWFERFPQYKGRPFYIAGESYAGHYVPQLAETIVKHNNASEASNINLKGIMVGNGLMNGETDDQGMDDFVWTHALISDQTHELLQKYCDSSVNASDSLRCSRLETKANEEIGNIESTNIYASVCSESSSNRRSLSSYTGHDSAQLPYDPCGQGYTYTYLNTPEVQRALRANVTGLHYPWDLCSSIIAPNTWRDSPLTMFPTYRCLIETGLQILIFSGDVDDVVPVTSTRYSLKAFKLPIKNSWHPWMDGKEVGGYSVIYEGLTFATVRGGGHEVPRYQPERALTMLKFFLAGKRLPSS